jgi:hypothetical protein
VSWVDWEFGLVTLATMLSPLTLIWSVLALVLSKRPLYTGGWFYLGALAATLAIGIAAAFVLGNAAASHHSSTPKTWVAILDVIGGVLLVVWVVRLLRRPADPEKTASMMERMRKVASSPWIAILGAGAVLANPGVFVPFALKVVSEEDPSRTQYFVEWTVYTVLGLLPLAVAIVLLVVARDWTEGVLDRARGWLVLHARTIGAVLIIALAASLLRSGIAGLTS